MTDVTAKNFGLLIAYVIPGFVAVASVGSHVPGVAAWLGAAGGATVGGFLYITLASVAVGMVLDAVRWLMLDRLHHATGVQRPEWDFAKLEQRREAFHYLVESHYYYYKFYSHMALAVLLGAASATQLAAGLRVGPVVIVFAAMLIAIVFLAASRDALQKYYRRTQSLLGV